MSPAILIGAGNCEEGVTEPDGTFRVVPKFSRV